MKKLVLFLLVVLITISTNAWIFPDNLETKTVTVYPAKMTFTSTVSGSSNDSRGYGLHDNATGVNINFGFGFLQRTDDGLFVGLYKTDSNSNEFGLGANISVGSGHPYSMKKVVVTFKKICSDNSIGFQTNDLIYNGTDLTSDGMNREITFEFNSPQPVAMLTYSKNGSWNTTSSLAKGWGYGVKGVLVSKIDIEYVPSTYAGCVAYNEYVNAINNRNISLPLLANNTQTTFNSNYNVVNGGDLNQDGKVNATDVVRLYNIIINGKDAVCNNNSYNGQRYVDLGLPSGNLWAECNIGASVPEQYGDYFAFGEIESSYLLGKVQFTNGAYSPAMDFGSTDGVNVHNKFFPPMNQYSEEWNGWEIPTKADYEELLANCVAECQTINGVNCSVFTSRINGNTICFPYSGYVTKASFVSSMGSSCFLWTRTIYSSANAYYFATKDTGEDFVKYAARNLGMPFRCIVTKK